MAHRKQQQDLEERNRKHLLETLADWDDDENIERGRDLFFSDRSVSFSSATGLTRHFRTRWRTQRQAARTREYQDDVRDRQLEEDEVKALEQESEEFLKRQMIEMAELEETQKQAGLLTEDAAPIKLAINPPVFPEVKKEEKPDLAGSRHRPGINFDGDEEEEDPAKKKKRTLVKLEYEGDGLTEAEKVAKRNARLLEIRAQIPRERKRLWSMDIEWAAINEVSGLDTSGRLLMTLQSLIRDKLRPFVHEKMTGFLGEVDEDLGDFVIEHVRGKKGPDELVDGLEPVRYRFSKLTTR